MTDITTALEAVRDVLDTEGCSNPGCFTHSHIRDALAALSTIEADRKNLLTALEWANNEADRLRAERDEAVAALREFCDDLVKWAGTSDPSNHAEFEQGYRAAIADVKASAAYRLARLST